MNNRNDKQAHCSTGCNMTHVLPKKKKKAEVEESMWVCASEGMRFQLLGSHHRAHGKGDE